MTSRCAACGGPYSAATGHLLSPAMALCGRCAISFKGWLKGRMGMMNARLKNKTTGERYSQSFGDAAASSIIGDK